MNRTLTLAKYEILRRLRTRAFVAASLALCGAFTLSLWLSAVRYAEQVREASAAAKMLRFTLAELPANPMSIFSSDLNDILYTPYDVGFPVYSVRALTSDASVNPFLRSYEKPDPLFVLTVLGSLFALLLSCDLFSGERESKRIALLLANCQGRATLLSGKVLGSFVALVAPAVVCWLISLAGLCVVGGGWRDVRSISVVFGLVALYFAVYILIGAVISVNSRTTAASAAKVLCVWIVTVLLVPLLGAAAAQRIYPIPSAQQIEADIARERTQNRNLANFEAAKLPPNDNLAFASLYGRYEGMTANVIHDRELWYQAQLQQELQRALWLERISPASCLRLAAMHLTHSSFADLIAYREAILRFKLELARYVLRKRVEQKKFGADVPRFIQPRTITGLGWTETVILMLYGLTALSLAWNGIARFTLE
jgi:ABC-type transport system involved in multi-copper enzyme maturation permease subunit